MKHLTLATLLTLLSLLPASPLQAQSASQTTIEVISYNIRLSRGNDGNNSWQNRRHASVEMVLREQPTIMGCQEMLPDQMEYLLDHLPEYDAIGVGRDDGKELGERMAIFYRTEDVELIRWGTFWLSDTPDVPSRGWDAAYNRNCTWGWFRHRASGRYFGVLNTHLDHIGKVAQQEGLGLIATNLRRIFPDGVPVFLTGDFNVEPTDKALKSLEGIMKDGRIVAPESDTRPTFNGWGNREEIVIDYVFLRNATAVSFRVLRDENYGAPYISDHYPVALCAEF